MPGRLRKIRGKSRDGKQCATNVQTLGNIPKRSQPSQVKHLTETRTLNLKQTCSSPKSRVPMGISCLYFQNHYRLGAE